MKGKRVTGPVVGPPAGRSKGNDAPVRKERASAWAKLENSEELQKDSTKSQPLRASQKEAHVLGATSKHKAQCTWKPTLRPIAKKSSELEEIHATPVVPDHTVATAPIRTDTSPMGLGRSMSSIADGNCCGPSDETPDTKPLQCATDNLQKQGCVGMPQLDVDCCIKSLLSWLNNNDVDQFDNSISQDARIALLSAVEASVSVIVCGESDLPSIRTSWGNDKLRVHCIAVWSIDQPTSAWKSDDWRMDLQSSGAVEYLMFCRIEVHRKERHQGQISDNEMQQAFADGLVEGEFVVACHLCSGNEDKLAPLESHGQYFAISCPSNIFPLRHATIHRVSDKAVWTADDRSVLPLPE